MIILFIDKSKYWIHQFLEKEWLGAAQIRWLQWEKSRVNQQSNTQYPESYIPELCYDKHWYNKQSTETKDNTWNDGSGNVDVNKVSVRWHTWQWWLTTLSSIHSRPGSSTSSTWDTKTCPVSFRFIFNEQTLCNHCTVKSYLLHIDSFVHKPTYFILHIW